MTTTVSGVLSIEDAASILNTTAIAVQRLIARRRLKATRLIRRDGSPGQWRILQSDIESYLSAGAPDLQPPEIEAADNDGVSPRWFSDRFAWMRQQLVDALTKISESQRLTDSQYASVITDQDQFAESKIVDLLLTDEMRALLRGPVYPGAPKVPTAPIPPFANWGDLWLSYRMHDAAAARISAGSLRMTAPIAVLYDSVDGYGALVDQAIQDTLAASFLSWSEYRPRPESKDGQLPDGATFRISYRLPVATYASVASLRELADRSAF